MMWRCVNRFLNLGFSNFVFALIGCVLLSQMGIPSPALAQTSSTPVIGVSPTSLTFTTVQGSANPPTQYINVSNTGGGTLSWSSTDNSGWITANVERCYSTGLLDPAERM